MGMMLKNLVHPYMQSTTVLCDNIYRGEFLTVNVLYSVLFSSKKCYTPGTGNVQDVFYNCDQVAIQEYTYGMCA